MTPNPLWREGVAIYFLEGHGFQVYFYILIILAPVEFFALFIPSLDAQMWSGSASLFRVAATTALLLVVYFALRVANQEFAPWRFKHLRQWRRDEGLAVTTIERGQWAFLASHAALSLLLCLPLLLWAGAIARTPLGHIGGALALLFFYALSYGVWGLAPAVYWERQAESRQIFIRVFFTILLLASALFYLPLNPVAFLMAYLNHQELAPLSAFGAKLPAVAVHYVFHLGLGLSGFLLHRWVLRRELDR